MSDKFANANPNYKDSLFRDFFNEPRRLLSLCNSLLDSNFSVKDLEINTLDSNFFSALKNDISCRLGNNFLVLVEHQSTVNENMPFRFLCYISELLNKLVQNKKIIYRKSLVTFPAPKFFVFYDGDSENEPVQRTLKLSDAFFPNASSLELIVYSFNINLNKKATVLEHCLPLLHYSTLISYIKLGLAEGFTRRNAIIHAINRCIDEDIMHDYLIQKKDEVFSMLDFQWNLQDAKTAWHDEGFEAGRNEERNFIALNMLRDGLSFEQIQKFTSLSLEQITKLSQQLS